MLHIDFETRSRTDLLKHGAYLYAHDPSTRILCLAWAFGDDDEPDLWVPGTPFPAEVRDYFAEGGPIYAHNAQFERLIWAHHRPIPVHVDNDRWRCTAFQARCSNMPAKLEDCARALRLGHQKDARGASLIRQLCVPRSDGSFCDNPTLLEELYEYCRQDVRVERAIHQRLREPTDEEWQDYLVGEWINDNGVGIDIPLAKACVEFAADETEELRQEVEQLTRGAVTKVRGEKLKAWVYGELPDELQHLMEKGGKIQLTKAVRERLLDEGDLPPVVREVLEASDAASKSSVSKYQAMLDRSDEDGIVRGAFVANGASASGRYSARGLQLHNFPRNVFDDPQAVRDEIIEALAEDCYPEFPGGDQRIMTNLARLLRGALIPQPLNRFLVSDWSAIEGRFAPWLSDSRDGEAKLEMYRMDLDVYSHTFARMNHIPIGAVTPPQRQIGKVAELALQYQGGYRAFKAMAAGYDVRVTDEEAEGIKHRWRAANPWAVDFWQTLEKAAIASVENPGAWYPAGRVRYITLPGVIVGNLTLFCQLPCGRFLTYPDVRIDIEDGPYGPSKKLTHLRAAFKPKQGEREWPRGSLYGGLLLENITQGSAASLLRHALRECERRELLVVAHVHDEIVVESHTMSKQEYEHDLQALHQIMNTTPEWASGLPLKADVEQMARYGK